GKSTLVDKTIEEYRKRGCSVGVLAIDPSSAFTGGALLGDRVRMMDHSLEKKVYIRSMASRGDLGGLARAARNTIRVLDAAGMDIIIVETVGAGQTEVQIATTVDATVVVLMPQLGDEVQAFKAGFSELYEQNVKRLEGEKELDALVGRIVKRDLDPETAASRLVEIIAKIGEKP